MEHVPYRNKALKNRKKDQQVIVLEVSIPGWLPGILLLAVAGKCGQMIYRRVRRSQRQPHGLDEEDMRRHRQFEEFKEKQQQLSQLATHYTSYPNYRNFNPIEQRRTVSLPTNQIEDNDSANEDSLSEYSRIPSPRQRDQESPLTPFEIYESCFNDQKLQAEDSLDLDNCYEDYALQSKDSMHLYNA